MSDLAAITFNWITSPAGLAHLAGLLVLAAAAIRLSPRRKTRLFLYSDGASELWTSEDTVLGEEGLLEIVQRQMHQTDDNHFLDGVLASLAALGSFNDDVTALVLTRRR